MCFGVILLAYSQSVCSYSTLDGIWYYHACSLLLQDFVFPANAAYPTGGPGAGRHIVIEMHYDNPNMEQGEDEATQ